MQRSRPEPSDRDRPKAARWTSSRWITLGVVALAVLPIVVATVRAVLDQWIPIGDDAYFSIRAADVWTRHIPLIGTWTSASLTLGHNVNNSGPIFFDLLAVPVLWFGSATGIAVGVGAMNVAAVIGIGWVAHRRGGLTLLVPAMIVTAGLEWSVGSQLLFDPWQPHALLLPFLCFVFLAWGMADGDLILFPWAVGVATLLVQTHLSYAYLVPFIGFAGVAGLAWRLWRRVRAGEETGAALRRRLAIIGAVTALIVVVLWVQPVIDQVAGEGNISALLDTGGGTRGPTLGAERATRVIAGIISLPPFWLRPSFADTLKPSLDGVKGGPGGVGLRSMPSMGAALASLAVFVALLAAAGVLARRRRDGALLSAVVVAGFALVAAFFTAVRIPVEPLGAAAHHFRYVWPIGAFAVFAILVMVVRVAAGSKASARRQVTLVMAGIAIVALLSLLTLPSYNAMVGPSDSLWAEPVVRDLDRQIAAHPPRGPLLMDFSNGAFLEPYSITLLAQLQRSHVEFVTDEAGQARQLGRSRRFNGHNARARVLYRLGDPALTAPPGERRIAFHAGLDRAERREMLTLIASGKPSARRTQLEKRWNRDTMGVFIAPLHGPLARDTP